MAVSHHIAAIQGMIRFGFLLALTGPDCVKTQNLYPLRNVQDFWVT